MEGLTLKNWVLGKKIASGACSDVYEVEPVRALGDCDGKRFVMKVSPLPQLPPAKLKNKKRKKTPAERNADALYAEHLLYQNHLRGLSGVPILPPGAYGEDQGFRFLVLERLGRTLEAVVQEHGPIPSSAAARLGREILETIKHMHVNNILYVDVKPENFMLDMQKENRVYCVDFGISDRYVLATGKHKEHKMGNVVGTPTFLSLNCHRGATASRKDDIESLLYVLIYMMRGNLPWQKVSSDDEGAKIKAATKIDNLCKSLPSEWGAMLKKIRECGFEEKPDYDFFAQQLEKLGGYVGSTEPFDWGQKSKTASGAVSVTEETSGVNPARKRTKKDQEKVGGNRAAAGASKTSKKASKNHEEEAESEDNEIEFVKDVAHDPRRRRKAAQKAIAGAAAASAAAKRAGNRSGRYNLRTQA